MPSRTHTFARFAEPDDEPRREPDDDRELDRRRDQEMEDRIIAQPWFRCARCRRLFIGLGPFCDTCQPPPTPLPCTP
jgi:hypothetical protein